MSKVRALYHIVFSTKYRQMTISEVYKRDLYRYINNLLKERNCLALRINGIGNHIHMLVNLHPSVSLAYLMRDIKRITSEVLVKDARFPYFQRWSHEYYACTISPKAADSVIEYIKAQEKHHGVESFDDEIKRLAEADGVNLHEKDLYE